jgi:putative transposase
MVPPGLRRVHQLRLAENVRARPRRVHKLGREAWVRCRRSVCWDAWLRRLYVLFFVSIGRRRVEYVACTSKPDTDWMSQQACNLLMDLGDRSQRPRFLIHDRDTKFSRAFDGIFGSEGIEIVRTPIQAPNANAYAERWVGSVRRECLDRLLIFGRRQLEHVLRVYINHFNQQRPHRALDLRPPDRGGRTDPRPTAILYTTHVRRRDLLGEYEAAA